MSKQSNADTESGAGTIIIPERKAITACLKQAGRPLTRKQLAANFAITDPDARRALGRRLKAMARDGQLIRNRRGRYGLIEKMDLIPGRVIGHPHGYGFVVPDEGGKDLFLSAREMRSILHNDRVLVRQTTIDTGGKRSGALVEIIERANEYVIGRYYEDSGIAFVVSDNKRISQDILIAEGNRLHASPGDYVRVRIVHQPDRHRPPLGHIAEVIGSGNGVAMAVEIAIRTYDLPSGWPDAVLKEANAINNRSCEQEVNNRKDLRHLPFVTIDGADARDFDDAVYCEKQGKGWRLLVAIADVSHYVKVGSALDDEARLRGTSVYFPESVIPMLPEVLSNGLCSLRPDEDRFTFTCELSIDQQGRVERCQFYKATIRSAARLTYDEMAAITVDRKSDARKRRDAIVTHLDELHSLYQVLHEQRTKQGLIDFTSSESRFEFNGEKGIESIARVKRSEAHRLIEEMMLVANVAASLWIQQNAIPALYRVHNTPKAEKLQELRLILSQLGLTLGGGEEPHIKDYANLMRTIANRDDAAALEVSLLRSMPLAVYSAENLGHFGLGFDAYTHFTSPIRRYPDLMVHRALAHIAAEPPAAAPRLQKCESYPFSTKAMFELAEHCSMTERRAEDASRDVVQRLKCLFMQDKVGKQFSGVVTSVTAFGLFVTLDEIFTEGLIHVSQLPSDYYHFDQGRRQLKGERSKQVFRIGQAVTVIVARVDMDERRIDFEWVDDG